MECCFTNILPSAADWKVLLSGQERQLILPGENHGPTAYTVDSRWRNRAEFLQGREAIEAFLNRKWHPELDYRLIKEIWGCRENRIAVRFAYEWHDDSGHWFRSYGNENWEFDEHGLMRFVTRASTTRPSLRASGAITGRLAAARMTIRLLSELGF